MASILRPPLYLLLRGFCASWWPVKQLTRKSTTEPPSWDEGNRASSDRRAIMHATDPKTDLRHGRHYCILSVEKSRHHWRGSVASAGPRGALPSVNLKVKTQIVVGGWQRELVETPDDCTLASNEPCSSQRHHVLIEPRSHVAAQLRW